MEKRKGERISSRIKNQYAIARHTEQALWCGSGRGISTQHLHDHRTCKIRARPQQSVAAAELRRHQDTPHQHLILGICERDFKRGHRYRNSAGIFKHKGEAV